MNEPTVLQITNFQEQYLTASMKRYKMKTPAWFRCPTDSVEVVELINGHPDGLAHLGAWERCQAWAVRNWKSLGYFVIRETPMTPQDIAIHCGLPQHQSVVTEMLTRVERLGWISSRSVLRFKNDCETFAERLSAQKTACVDNSTVHNKTVDWDTSARTFINITDEDMQQWRETHPNLDIDRELRKMADWLTSNPRRYKQWRRFITNWLNRATPDGPAPITAASGWIKDLGGGSE